MTYIIGIDPGITGAVVVLQKGAPIEWFAMPTMVVGTGRRVDSAELARFLEPFAPPHAEAVHAYVELVGAMPGQGVASMFAFGHAAGSVAGVLGALRIPVTMITPQQWKKRAGLIGKDKDAARSRAIQLWPAWADLGAKGRGQSLADAALIARHGVAA